MPGKIERIPAEDIMNRNVIAVKENENLENVAKIMAKKEIGSVVVVDGYDAPKGIITERDMIRIMAKKGRGFFNLSAGEVMSKPLITANSSTDIGKIEKEMKIRNIKYLPVVESNKLVGIVTLKDVIKYLEFRVSYLTLDAGK